MRTLTATFCLTLAVLLGSAGCDDNNKRSPQKTEIEKHSLIQRVESLYKRSPQKTEIEKQRDFEEEQKKIKKLEQKYNALMFSNSMANKASFTFEIQEYFKNKNNIPHFFVGCIYDVEKVKNEFVLNFKFEENSFRTEKEFFIKAIVSNVLLNKFRTKNWFKVDPFWKPSICRFGNHVLVATINNVRARPVLRHDPEDGFYIGDPVIFLEGEVKDIHEVERR